jgi:hypothetical protein
MGNVTSALLGAGNRPRQGRAVLEILALLYVLNRLGAGSDGQRAQIAAEQAKESGTNSVATSHPPTPLSDSARQSPIVGSVGRQIALVDGNCSRRPSFSSPPPTVSGSVRADTVLARWNAWLRQFNPLQVVLGVMIGVHIWNNLALLLGLNAPHHSLSLEPDMHCQ